MTFKKLKKELKRLFLFGTLAGSLCLPLKSEAIDFYNVLNDTHRVSESWVDSVNFYGRHHSSNIDGFDFGKDVLANTDPLPSGARVVLYTHIEGYKLSDDRRSLDSTLPYNIYVNYLSNDSSFEGRSQIKFNFKTTGGTEYINPEMFYWGEFVLPAEFHTNNVQQTDKKAMLANFDTNRDVYFNVDGITNVVHDTDFAQFNISRTWNSIYFQQPENATVTVSNLTDNSVVTNAQRFVYDDMTNTTFQVVVGTSPERHLQSLELVLQDISTGDYSTNTIQFPTNHPDYQSSFSTNLTGLAGSNAIRSVQTGLSQTSQGTPYSWLYDQGLAPSNDLDIAAGGYAVYQHFILDTDPLDPAEAFGASPFYVDNGTPPAKGILMRNTSSNVLYDVDLRTNMVAGSWHEGYFNSLEGTGGDLMLDNEDLGSGFYRIRARRK